MAAVESADTGLWCYNYRTRKFFLSDYAQEILGRSRGHRMPDWTEFGARLHPDDVAQTRLSMRRHTRQGAPYSVEYRYRLDDDEYIWLEARGRGSWDRSGAIIRTAGTLVDITEKKEAEFLRQNIMSAMTADTSLDGKVATVLRQAAAYLGLEVGVLAHVSDGECEILHSNSSQHVWKKGAVHPLQDVIGSDVYSREDMQAFHNLERSPLSEHPARWRMGIEAFVGAPVFVKGAKFGLLCFAASAPLKAEFSELQLAVIRQLAQWAGDEIGRAANLASLLARDALKAENLACIGDAVLTVSKSGCIEDANPAATTLFGWNAESLRRMHIEQLLPGAAAISGPEGGLLPVRSRQDVGVRRNGERMTVLMHVSDVQLLDRRLSTVVVTDLTLVKQAEAAKRDFVSTVSHELRTPLTSIAGALALIESGVAGTLPSSAAGLIEIAKRNSERLVRLVNDILDMDKLENGKFDVSLSRLDLAAATQEAIAANAAYAQRFGVTFEFDTPKPDLEVVADPDRILQVLTNLLSNAAKFTPAGSCVKVSIVVEDGFARVSVRDYGPGVPDALLPRLFEKFVQGENVNARERAGSGLGLAISRNLMRLMGGDVVYSHEEGRGSTFSMLLPCASRDLDSSGCSRRPQPCEQLEGRP
jgi:PAS domain S-box-containing protein